MVRLIHAEAFESRQTRRHLGAYWDRAPPNENCAPPSEDCAPKKITGSWLLECKSRSKLVFASVIFVLFVDWHRISWYSWDEDLFFLEITCFRPEKPLEFPISAGKSLTISVRTFFFLEITCFRPEKPLKFAILAGKTLWIFGLHLVHLIQTGTNFSCPRAPLEFTQINFSCPPKIYFCPPVALSWRRAWIQVLSNQL